MNERMIFRQAVPGLIGAAVVVLAQGALGADYTWDASGAAPLNDGGGSWASSGGSNWEAGGSYGAWGNTTADKAIFGVGSGAAGTVNVSGTITLNGLTFNAPGSGIRSAEPCLWRDTECRIRTAHECAWET